MSRSKRFSDEALLEAAMPVIFAKAPGEFSLADVAKAVGLAPATLIQRFGSKQAMVAAALELANAMNFAALDALPPDVGAEAVIRIFIDRTPDPADEVALGDQLQWLRAGMVDPRINAISRDYFARFRAAVAARMPPLPLPADEAVLLVEAQWHGAMTQWGIGRVGHLRDHVERSLRNWFALAGCFPAD
jgi:AcrR family transcriptional regulator